MSEQTFPHETIKSRLVALIQALILDSGALEDMVKSSNFKSHFKPVILGLVKQLPSMIGPMLESVSEEDLSRGLEQIRDEFIPFLLNDPIVIVHNENIPAMLDGIHPEEVQTIAALGKNKSFGIGENENSPSG